jgi:hypothetical protein
LKKENKTRVSKIFKNTPNFPLWEEKLNKTKMAKEYCWAITQVAGLLRRGRSGVP